MTVINTSELVKSLSFEEHPLHVFRYQDKVAFLAQEVGNILDISKPTDTLRRSKAAESAVDYDLIPAVSLPLGGNFLPSHTQHVSILYLSGFFLFVLRSNKPIAVPFTRWVIREAIPIALEKKKPKDVTQEDLKLMELAAKHESLFARQILIERGFIEATPKNKQLTIDDAEGGDDGR